ncbi:MAG: hypothetical protein ACJ757_12210 [Gaiellaceae bacterium]
MRLRELKLALAAAVALSALAAGAGSSVAGSGLPEQPAGVDWGNSHFNHPDDLSVWLSNRGVRYEDWLRRHPRGRYLWTHPQRAAVPAVEQSRPSPPVAEGGPGSGAPRWMYVLVVLLLLLALTPSRLLARVVPGGRADSLGPARTALAAAALSLGLGVLIASLL